MRSTCYSCGKIHSCQRFSERKQTLGAGVAGDETYPLAPAFTRDLLVSLGVGFPSKGEGAGS